MRRSALVPLVGWLIVVVMAPVAHGAVLEVSAAATTSTYAYDEPSTTTEDDAPVTAAPGPSQVRTGASSHAVGHRYDDAVNLARTNARPGDYRLAPNTADVGLSARGLQPAPGTRVRPDGVPEGWRIDGTRSAGGTRYHDPTNPGNAVRVMQGNPNSPYPTSQSPYVRWQQDGHALDAFGNKLPTPKHPDAHIPLEDFSFLPELFG